MKFGKRAIGSMKIKRISTTEKIRLLNSLCIDSEEDIDWITLYTCILEKKRIPEMTYKSKGELGLTSPHFESCDCGVITADPQFGGNPEKFLAFLQDYFTKRTNARILLALEEIRIKLI